MEVNICNETCINLSLLLELKHHTESIKSQKTSEKQKVVVLFIQTYFV